VIEDLVGVGVYRNEQILDTRVSQLPERVREEYGLNDGGGISEETRDLEVGYPNF
jgi:hypothetical protein